MTSSFLKLSFMFIFLIVIYEPYEGINYDEINVYCISNCEEQKEEPIEWKSEQLEEEDKETQAYIDRILNGIY